ncbi:MAG TPA: isoprenylcysteine carboxylmethyltransferase family protein [Xanthobacteraceae bacterium]|nr:isoprenylcysteine carboxylmethyltransferase family protein [Xanthobacteraceae bacterium]
MTRNERDNPGVIALPPLIALATLAAGLGLDRLVPIGAANAMLTRSWRFTLAAILLLTACWIVFRAVRTFGRVGTPLDVRKASVALAADDIYAKTRNPMYQALGLLLLALAVGLASDWTALLLVPWALVMHFGVVLREEAYLEKKFGEEYRQYLRQVPRYGWPL